MLDEIKEYVARSPFQSLVIKTADGLSRPVPSLDQVLIISPQHVSSVALQAEHYDP